MEISFLERNQAFNFKKRLVFQIIQWCPQFKLQYEELDKFVASGKPERVAEAKGSSNDPSIDESKKHLQTNISKPSTWKNVLGKVNQQRSLKNRVPRQSTILPDFSQKLDDLLEYFDIDMVRQEFSANQYLCVCMQKHVKLKKEGLEKLWAVFTHHLLLSHLQLIFLSCGNQSIDQ